MFRKSLITCLCFNVTEKHILPRTTAETFSSYELDTFYVEDSDVGELKKVRYVQFQSQLNEIYSSTTVMLRIKKRKDFSIVTTLYCIFIELDVKMLKARGL